MCDDLIAHHHRISSPSHIPLSNSPTWFTTQSYTNRSLNRTWLFLPPESIDQINFPKFFEINPKWSIYSFDKRVLRLFDKCDTTEMLYEMRLSQPSRDPLVGGADSARWLNTLKVVEDSAWFRAQFPEKATCVSEEDVLSITDPATSARLGHVTFLGDSTRLLISSIKVSESYAHSYRGKEIEGRLLMTVIRIAERSGLKVWITASAEDTESLGVYFALGFVINRTMWVVEKNGAVEEEAGRKKGSEWKLGNWEGGMVGWKEQWAAALDRIMAGQA